MPTFGGGAEKCILCAKSVYAAEKVTTNSGNIYHKNCFRCTKCDKLLTGATASESATTHRLYCKVHYEEIRTNPDGETAAPLELAAKKVELEEEVETLHEGAKAWVELAPSLLTSVPALAPAEGSEECFVRATVSQIDGDKCVVTTEGGVECTVPRKLVVKADSGGTQSNNLMLVELNEPSLLHNLRARFDGGTVYTYTGELELMCLNPYERLPCYEEQVMQQCKDGTYHEPHIWALTERIFKALSDKGTLAQSVVVSGESGAGKTEANKHVLAYLRWRAMDGEGGTGQRISEIIGQSNVLLEALGNAKTTNNNNSSRFGKYLELAFAPSSNSICGAKFKTFLLEKSRVAHQAPSERNFHAFYLLLAGADANLRERLGLRQPAEPQPQPLP